MSNAVSLLKQGMAAHQRGDLAAAGNFYQQAKALAPQMPDPEIYLGIILCQQKDYAQACIYFKNASTLGADLPLLHINYGLALLESANAQEALTHFTRGQEQDPHSSDCLFNLGRCQLKLQQFAKACESFEKALSINPSDAQVWSNLALAQVCCNRPGDALKAAEQALRMGGETANLRRHQAQAYLLLKDYKNALNHFHRSLELDNDSPESLTGLAITYAQSGELTKAQELCSQTSARFPGNEAVECAWSTVLSLTGEFETAREHANNALSLNPQSAQAHSLLGYIFHKLGQTAQAENHFALSLQLNPHNPATLLNRANNFIAQGRVEEALETCQLALQLQPENDSILSNILLYMHYHSSISQQDIFALTQKWAAAYASRPAAAIESLPPINPEEELRIGFLSGDLRRHSVAFFIEPLLRHLPELRTQIFIYSNNLRDDSITQKLMSYRNQWRNLRQLSDDEAEDLIRQDKLEVLIDLSGHTDNNRLRLFSRKICPVQLSWLGYPDSTGLRGNVYRLADSVTDVQDAQQYYSECLTTMSGPFLCYNPPENPPQITTPHNPQPVFGSFNALAKISDNTLRLWSAVLAGSAGSRLLLKSRGLDDRQTRDFLLQRMKQAGIDSARVTLMPMEQNFQRHLDCYNQIDVALDTVPYNGTTTTCEALLMGRPVVTLPGCGHCSRVGASLLLGAGMPEYIAGSDAEYIAVAQELARRSQNSDFAPLQIRETFLNSNLCNQRDFTHRFRQALENISAHYNAKYASK